MVEVGCLPGPGCSYRSLNKVSDMSLKLDGWLTADVLAIYFTASRINHQEAG